MDSESIGQEHVTRNKDGGKDEKEKGNEAL